MILRIDWVGRHIRVQEIEDHDDDGVDDTWGDLDQGVVHIIVHAVTLYPLKTEEGRNTAGNEQEEEWYLDNRSADHLSGEVSLLFDFVRVMTEILIAEMLIPFQSGIVVDQIGETPFEAYLGRLPLPPFNKDCNPYAYQECIQCI